MDVIFLKKLGLIVNPIAGMGGRVGLKGTDGIDMVKKARNLGAFEEAPNKAKKALEKLRGVKDDILIVTCSGNMGEKMSEDYEFKTEVILNIDADSTDKHTIIAARKMLKKEVDLLLFVGGDGTARDIYNAIGNELVVLGVPAGVKIHSPVYASTPEKAGELAKLYLQGKKIELKEEEVIDIDEEAFRNDIVNTRLYGYLKIPYEKDFVQNKKAPTPLNEETSKKAIALDIIDYMKEDIYYIIGPGSTTRWIMTTLELPYTLLGVDILKNKKIVTLDVTEEELLEYVNKNSCKLIITPTGGQGFLLGRGNQQISNNVIQKVGKENIIIVSVDSKLIELKGKPLFVYTGDRDLDEYLQGYYKVKIGYNDEIMYPVVTYY